MGTALRRGNCSPPMSHVNAATGCSSGIRIGRPQGHFQSNHVQLKSRHGNLFCSKWKTLSAKQGSFLAARAERVSGQTLTLTSSCSEELPGIWIVHHSDFHLVPFCNAYRDNRERQACYLNRKQSDSKWMLERFNGEAGAATCYDL
jgi:hypothetical protein